MAKTAMKQGKTVEQVQADVKAAWALKKRG
jgi:predicted RNase H-like HicB family nuclease